jgi:large subunit ribosomal protein L25
LPAVGDERVKLEVKERTERGSRAARRLRRDGFVPGVLYGRGDGARAIAIPERELRRVLTGSHGLHAILDVVLEGQKKAHPSVLKDYQQDSVRGKLAHVDLLEVRLDRPIQAQVVVELAGEPEGVTEGGVLSQVVREINVEALPMEIPERIEVDVSAMAIGDTLRLADVAAQDGVTFLDDRDETVLATVTLPTRVVEPEEELEEAEAEAVEAAEGAEAPEGAAATPPEPGGETATGAQGEPGTTPG